MCPYKCISFSEECFCCLCIQLQSLHWSRTVSSSACLTALWGKTELQPSPRLPAVSQWGQQFYKERDRLDKAGTKSVRLTKWIHFIDYFSWQETQAFIRSTLLNSKYIAITKSTNAVAQHSLEFILMPIALIYLKTYMKHCFQFKNYILNYLFCSNRKKNATPPKKKKINSKPALFKYMLTLQRQLLYFSFSLSSKFSISREKNWTVLLE